MERTSLGKHDIGIDDVGRYVALQGAAGLATACSGRPYIPHSIEEAARAYNHSAFADVYAEHLASFAAVQAQCDAGIATLAALVRRPNLLRLLRSLPEGADVTARDGTLLLPGGQAVRTSSAEAAVHFWTLCHAPTSLAHHLCEAAHGAVSSGHEAVIAAVQHQIDTRIDRCTARLKAALDYVSAQRTPTTTSLSSTRAPCLRPGLASCASSNLPACE